MGWSSASLPLEQFVDNLSEDISKAFSTLSERSELCAFFDISSLDYHKLRKV